MESRNTDEISKYVLESSAGIQELKGREYYHIYRAELDVSIELQVNLERKDHKRNFRNEVGTFDCRQLSKYHQDPYT